MELHSYTVVQTVKGLANDRLTRDYEFVRPGSGESSDTRCEAITSVLVYPLRQSQWVEDNALLFTSPGQDWAVAEHQLSTELLSVIQLADPAWVWAGQHHSHHRHHRARPRVVQLLTTRPAHHHTSNLQPICLLGSSQQLWLEWPGCLLSLLCHVLECCRAQDRDGDMARWSPPPNMCVCSRIYPASIVCSRSGLHLKPHSLS